MRSDCIEMDSVSDNLERVIHKRESIILAASYICASIACSNPRICIVLTMEGETAFYCHRAVNRCKMFRYANKVDATSKQWCSCRWWEYLYYCDSLSLVNCTANE
jgi:hypothetical protein